MAWRQLVTPNPNVACKPRYCERYVENTIGRTGVYGSATIAWNKEANKHTDRSLPSGVWVPVYWSLANNPDGHTALAGPDGRIYSASHPTSTSPVVHSNLAAIEKYYGGRLKWRGWGENIAGRHVVEQYTPAKVKTYGYGYITKDALIGRVAAFLREKHPEFTPKAALGNYIGPSITGAIKAYQKLKGLKVDGRFAAGGETLRALTADGFKG